MKGTRGRVAAAGGLALAMLLVAGCGGGSGATGAPAAVDDKPATGQLTIWAQAEEAAALPKFADEFMKLNPGLKITVTPLPWDAAHSKYQTAIASGTTPDMAQMGTTWMSDFSEAFAPVPQGIDTSGYFEGAVNTTKVNGTALGVPWYVDTRVFYYRKDLAEKAGYTQCPTTWDDFTAFTKAMQTKAGAKWGVGLPASGADSFQSMLMFPWSAGAHLMNSDQSQWTLDTPEMTKAMTYYKSFFADGIANPSPDGSPEAAFVNGTTPVLVAGPAEIGSLSQAGGGDAYKAKIGVCRVPADKSSTSFIGGSDLVVFKNSKNADAAWKFARWLSKPDIQVQWQKAVGDLPALKSAWDDPSLKGDPLLKVFGDQLQSTDAPPTVTTWTQVSAQADKALEQIVRGGDPATILKDLQSQAQSIGTK